MNPIPHLLAIAFYLTLPSVAEDPLMLGIRGAFSAFAPVPEETSFTARSTAAELLARNVKIRNGNHLLQYTPAFGSVWTETHKLQITRVTAQAVSTADQANGISESYIVSIDCEMYRNYDGKTGRWSQWHNGRNPFVPPCIQVTRGTQGQWTAHSSMLASFVAFTSHGDSSLIPHGTQPAPSLPTAAAAGPVRMPQKHAPEPTRGQHETLPKPGAQMDVAVNEIMAWAVIIAFFIAIVGIGPALVRYIYQKNRQPAIRGRSAMGPPRIPPVLSSAVPPPLPGSTGSPYAVVIEGRSHLLTEAEQKFCNVLEPLVRPFCMISSKVRLADLFSVTPGRGQQAAFNKVSSKHIDFVLTETGTSRILCAIELDDSSHKRPDRMERDNFVNELFAANRLPLMRVPVAWTYSPQTLRDGLLKAGVVLSNAA